MPVKYMAELTRGTLTGLDVNLGSAFLVTGVWCLGAFVFTALIIRRRQ